VWAKTLLNRKLGIDGTGFALALTSDFDDSAERGTSIFQDRIRALIGETDAGFPSHGHVNSVTWFWLTRP
jgi:hypothetical protein